MKPDKHQQRAQNILKLIVEQYIDEGLPVGSKTLSNNPEIKFSSATIRNIMSDLEEQGYIRSLHTSSGRVPTQKAYRLFVDRFLSIKKDNRSELTELEARLATSVNAKELVAQAPNILSSLTHFAGLITIPQQQTLALRHIEFLKLSGHKILTILVTNEQDVQNRIIETAKEFSVTQLEQVANYLNHHFIGTELNQIQSALVHAMQNDKQSIDELMQASIELATKAMNSDGIEKADFMVQGQTNLLNFIETPDISKIRNLLEAFNEKQTMVHLMEQCVASDGLQLFIGNESGLELFEDFTLVTAPYQTDDNVIGMLGVIGPTRMNYDKVIPVVDMTAKLLTNALTNTNNKS